VRGLWFSPQHRRLCYMSSAGEPGTAGLNFVPAASVLGLGLLGRDLGTVLALTRGFDLASLMRVRSRLPAGGGSHERTRL
jgi:hypothetical protein